MRYPDTTRCPTCNATAWIVDRFVLDSTDGPIEHARLRCWGLDKHHLTMPTAGLAHAG